MKNIIPSNVEVKDLTRFLKLDMPHKIFDLISKNGYYKLPLFEKNNLVIFNIIYYLKENDRLVILAQDENDEIKDFIFDENECVFKYLTPHGHEIDWKYIGFSKSPDLSLNLKQSSINFNIKGYKQRNSGEDFSDDDEISEMVKSIKVKEPAVANAIKMVIRHIYGTYSDKYAKGQNIIDTKKMLYDKERGDFLNIYQVNRYLQRYLTQGSAKSHLIKDIEKAIHYLVFELARRIMIGDVNEIEPKI